MSALRKQYTIRLIIRCIVFVLCSVMCFLWPESFGILEGWSFFHKLSPLHILWAVWVFDTLLQIIPVKNKLPLGSMKLFSNRFRPIRDKINYEALREYIISSTKSAYKVFILWCLLVLVIGVLYYTGIINQMILFMLCACFYVCDLICVLIWCPFRLIAKSRCCTTCRIFNWDHMMMFSPFVFIKGFYGLSLVFLAFLAWLLWELCIMMYPERFWDHSNAALKCSECTDKLCTQYCQKLRKK